MGRKSLKDLLNLCFSDYTNQTFYVGKYDLPYVKCNISILNQNNFIDYLTLYNELKDYHKTENTCICFYQYDRVFDNICGLYNAIYYNNKELLNFYKKRFKGVKYFIAPDFSQVGDAPTVENLYRYFKARIVSLWLTLELGAIVIPNISYGKSESFFDMLEGMDDTNVVAFSIKGSMINVEQKELLNEAIKYVVDNLNLNAIIVYSDSTNNEKVRNIFEYAIKNGINIIIPNNSLKLRNERHVINGGENNGKI